MPARTTSIATLTLLLMGTGAGAARAQEQVSGSIMPDGPPAGEVVRIDAGDACVIELVQGYVIDGGLSGRLEIDYRIFVAGPCGSPQGTFDEHWIARGTFEGTTAGASTAATLWYRADVAPGGIVDGTMGLAGDVRGMLSVTGRFSDGRLSYRGMLQRS